VAKNGILIVGAGLAGLTLALALSKRGIASTVIEKQTEIEPSKWAIAVYPQSIGIFDELGILEDVKQLGMPLRPVEFVLDGEPIFGVKYNLIIEPQYNFNLILGPSELRQVMKRHALSHGVEILEGVDCQNFILDASGNVIGVQALRKGNQQLKISCKAVVDATGYKSVLRNQLEFHSEVRKHNSIIVSFFVDNFPHGLDRPQSFLGNGYVTVSLPCTTSRLCLAYMERGLTLDKLKEKGGEVYVKRRILDAAPGLWRALDGSTANLADGSMMTIQPTISRVTPFSRDCAVVIGDSAHSVHPGTGSGAQLAFEDSIALASVIQNCVIEGDFSPKLVNEYESKRRPFMKVADITSRSVDSITFAKGRFGCWMRKRQLRAINKLMTKKEYQEIVAGIRAPTRKEVFVLTMRTIIS